MKIKKDYLFTPLFHHPFIPSSFEEGKPFRFMLLFNVLYSSIGTEGWLKTFSETKISKYYTSCVTSVIHSELVKKVSLNLYADIKRIKEFHKMPEVNSKKFAACQATWIVKIKPIQLINFDPGKRKYFVLANEFFALQTVVAHLYNT